MGDRKILVGFEKRNVLDPHDPMFDFVIQENEIVTMKYGGSLSSLSTAGVGDPSDSLWTATRRPCGFGN